MKIFAVIRNYGQKESWRTSPFGEGTPDWYLLPDSSVLRSGNPFFIPDFDTQFVAFPSVVYRIGRLGKSIARRFAGRYIDSVSAGCCIVAEPLLRQLRSAGDSWTRAVAFDRSCFLGNFVDVDTFINNGPLKVSMGDEEIDYSVGNTLLPVDALVEALSATSTLKTGDYIFGALTPEGIPLEIGNRLRIGSAFSNFNYLDINIK